jgi:hypothetical protein
VVAALLWSWPTPAGRLVLPSVLSTCSVLRYSEPHDDRVAMRGFQGDDIDSSCAGALVVSVA